jgi:2-oxoisovalerate dehydrogenase E1 component subunit alpha
VKDVAMRASAYGFEGEVVEGNDVLACFEASKRAVDKARNGGGPTLIEMKTYRFHPHTSDDDDRTYRSREEVEEAKRNDSIIVFGDYLKERGVIDDDGIEKLRAEVKGQVDAEVEAAWNAPDPEPKTALDHVFAPLGEGMGFKLLDGRRKASGNGSITEASPAKSEPLETTGGEATPAEPPAEGRKP